MKRSLRSAALLGAFAVAASGLVVAVASPAAATDVPQPVPFAQDWTNAGLITVNDDWSGVPGVIGYLGDDPTTTASNVDARTIVGAAPTAIDVIANQPAPTISNGGVAEFASPDPVVALQGSGTADFPNLVVTLSTVGAPAATSLSYTVRDIDASTDDAVQQLAVQYRTDVAAEWTNLPDGYLADATAPAATQAIPVVLPVPAELLDLPFVQIRFLTTNAGGNDEWIGIDDIAVGPTDTGPADPVASCPATLAVDEGETAGAVVSAVDADSAIADIAITSPAVPGITLVPGEPGHATLTVDGTTLPGTYPVDITFTTDDDQTTACTVTVTVTPAAVLTSISAIQGTGPASDMLGRPVIVEAVVTSLFTRNDIADGFFVQEDDADADADPATSEGLFVFCRGTCPALAAGDLVRLTGTVAEFFEMTQVDVTGDGSVELLSSGNPLPAPTPVDLPATASTKLPPTFEPVEGMVVSFPEELTVAEHFELARYGQLRLASDGRTFQFTHDHAPDPAGYAAFVDQLNRRTVILDDDNNDQNDAVTGAVDEAFPYPSGGLSTTNDVRAGDTVAGLTGVLHYSFAGQTGTDAWRVRPIPGVAYTFDGTNPRPTTVEPVGGRLRVAAFNVLNYFTTIDQTSSSSSGPCGPLGTLDCRGADSAAELVRQRDKEIVAIGALDADVVGLVELQNDDGTAVRDLIAGLNARPGAVPYAELPTGTIGGDAIKVTFIYRPSRVVPVGAFDVLDSSDDPRFIDTRNRPALNQQFQEILTGERFTASINHLKSKGSACTPDDPDLLDGQGNCSVTRTNAAAALADHLAELVAAGWDRDVIIMGDLNSYRQEAPIAALEAKGYVNLIDGLLGPDAYSFLFDGQLGYLDHALATPSLATQVTGVTEWHVNADEAPLFDYNDAVLDAPGEAAFERESTVGELYAPDERRSSDHDPVLIGLDLASLTVDDALIVQSPRGGGTLVLSGTTGTTTAACPTLKLQVNGAVVDIGRTTQLGRTTTCISLSRAGLVTFDRRTGAVAAAVGLPTSFTLTGDEVTFVLTVDTTTYGVVRDGRRAGRIWTST